MSILRRVVGIAITIAAAHAIYAQPVNPHTLGAKGDNSTDDTAAIQSAIDNASSNNGTVTLPEGTYKITAPLVIDAPIHVQGSRAGTTLNFSSLSSGAALTIGGSKPIVGAVIEGFTIIGNNNIIGLNINGGGSGKTQVIDSTFRDMQIKSCKTGIVAKWAWDDLFSNIRCQNCLTGAALGVQFNACELTRCSFVSGNLGVQLINCDGVNFTSCEFANMKTYGLSLFQSVVNLTMPYFEGNEHLAIVGAATEQGASVFTIQSGIVNKDIIVQNRKDIVNVMNTRTTPEIIQR